MKRIAIKILLLMMATPALAADWTQFRGPGSRGVAQEKNLPLTWSDKKNIYWKAELPGRGLSNPIIVKGRIFVTCSSGWQQDRLHVLCFDEKSGKQLWERQFWSTGHTQSHPKTCMAAPTPVTDGENIYALFATQDVAALDSGGNLLWFRSLTQDYPTIGNNVGMASSPVLSGDVLLIAVENVGESFAVGIDKNTGKNLWRVKRPKGINWVTPLVIEKDDQAQVLFQSQGNLSSYDPATGQKLWTYKGGNLSKIPSPTFGEGLIFTPGKEFLAIEPGSAKKKPVVAWKERKLSCGYASPLLHNGKVYTLATNGALRCADALTGNILWEERLEGPFAASPVLADGKMYLVNEEGTTTVIEPGSEANILKVNRINDKILATPALANGAIYLRSDDYLYCIREKK